MELITRFESRHHHHFFLLIHFSLCLWSKSSYPFVIYDTRRWSRSCETLDIFHLFWCLDTPRSWWNDGSYISESSKILKASLCNLLCLWSGTFALILLWYL
jgi:hypothetical protein